MNSEELYTRTGIVDAKISDTVSGIRVKISGASPGIGGAKLSSSSSRIGGDKISDTVAGASERVPKSTPSEKIQLVENGVEQAIRYGRDTVQYDTFLICQIL